MKTPKLAGAAWLLALLLAGRALAQDGNRSGALRLMPIPEPTLDRGGSEYVVTGDQAPTPGTSPAKPQSPAVPEKPAVAINGVNEEPAAEAESEEQGFKLLKGPWLERRRIDVRGWIDQGVTWNPDNPTIRFNGPVAYNDRSNEYMLNQLYWIVERVTKTEDGGWDMGGRVDLLYGTDHRFPLAFGLDNQWSESQRFYGLAMPQLYTDVAYNKLLLRVGHMLAPCGYENVQAPENFFYSHSYGFLYGQPTTITAAMLAWNLNDRFSINGGVDTGWNAFESINRKAGGFGGVNWKSRNEKTTVAWEFFLNTEQPAGSSAVRSHSCLVVTHKVSERITWALENNYGFEPNVATEGVGAPDAHWLSFANYLFYQINPCWTAGLRYEWLKDRNGTQVIGLDTSHGILLNGIPTEWQELALGLNYKPNKNVIVRSELRWDGASPLVFVPDSPFDDYTKRHQFLWGTDLILRF